MELGIVLLCLLQGCYPSSTFMYPLSQRLLVPYYFSFYPTCNQVLGIISRVASPSLETIVEPTMSHFQHKLRQDKKELIMNNKRYSYLSGNSKGFQALCAKNWGQCPNVFFIIPQGTYSVYLQCLASIVLSTRSNCTIIIY